MRSFMPISGYPIIVAVAALAAVMPVAPGVAQLGQSSGYKFLQAVREAKGEDVTKMLDQPGTTIVNTRDPGTGEGALHIVVRRDDEAYLRFLLSRGADPDLKDGAGNSPLLLAAASGETHLIDILVSAHANVNLANSGGETPLIRAVQRRDLPMVRTLLADGADPDQADRLAGMSARDYVHQDTRSPALAKMIDDSPKQARRAVSGPKL